MKGKRSADPDLQSQLESLLDQVWRSEADWRLLDRVDALVRLESLRALRAARRLGGAQGGPAAFDLPSENAA
ncbi:MAG: hypothetical protein AUG06_01115 [Actinobacteria bacterium 13_1_20CM_2_65_11]|nr:MAG: hypothetical protein AUH69_09330 [Actinobacteria bacterium 13_1_40CM_4_65_12]OLD49343.1 MAG: hypothetical protein AUI42_08185 [Actinobacteria bacterium 13_1_40CM_2_65_8]OLE81437.1 MAG: hypothetical protein AUG06_01115 [Actinobacteria bacterium 13_1_20CM_2_65_11]